MTLTCDGLESVTRVTLQIQVADEFHREEVMWRDKENKSFKSPMMRPISEEHCSNCSKNRENKGKGHLRGELLKYVDLQGVGITIRKRYMVIHASAVCSSNSF